MVGLESYDGGEKQSWRGWQWNRIAEMLPGCRQGMRPSQLRSAARKAVALYLCGPDDMDREKALRSGFLNHNLIAVDIDEDNIENVRRTGGLGIVGNLADAIAMWPPTLMPSAIVADLTGGLTKSALDIHAALVLSGAIRAGTVVSINLLRGRDPQTNEWRAQHLDIMLSAKQSAPEEMQPPDGVLEDLCKHRGYLWWTSAMMDLARQLHPFVPRDRGVDDEMAMREVMARLITMSRPWRPYSYHSGPQVFDSVVGKWPLNGANGRTSGKEEWHGWAKMRAKRNEGGKVRFDYQSYVAKFAALVGARNRMIQTVK